tara:strand:+ start:846 stop:1214 length:369 start_codon:yes stop_codon:yes gene_type:complete
MNDKLRAYTEAAQKLLAGQNYSLICELNSDDSVTFKDFGEGITAPSQSDLDAKATELDNGYPMEELRTQRNKLLAESDWMAVSDRTPTDAQKTYRQALRDLPANQTPSDMQLSNITWPTKPS